METNLSDSSAAGAPRAFVVPVVHYVRFGGEVKVEAASPEEAARLATDGRGFLTEGYDWNRMEFQHAELGTWQPALDVGEETVAAPLDSVSYVDALIAAAEGLVCEAKNHGASDRDTPVARVLAAIAALRPPTS